MDRVSKGLSKGRVKHCAAVGNFSSKDGYM